jgi:peroxiredoxin
MRAVAFLFPLGLTSPRMPTIDWPLAAAIATVFSSIAFAASAIAVMLQLRQMTRERYFSVTAHLFEMWQSPEFQRDQLFLLHEAPTLTWETFCELGRGKRAERAIHRVGGYYDRVGNLVRHNLIHKEEILPTIGGYAVAVWYRIAPLVKELRLRENAVLFQNYESLLPECHDCYVPGIEQWTSADGMQASAEAMMPAPACDIAPSQEPELLAADGVSATSDSSRFLDRGQGSETEMPTQNATINGPIAVAPDLLLPDSDGVTHSLSEFTAPGLAVLVYARGAWCPFCLRQLSDYAERYRDFRQSGIEVVAISPESRRKSRRLRTSLKLPFTVLSDTRYEAANNFGLIEDRSAGPRPATIMLDGQRRVKLSSSNQGTKCLLAQDALEYARALKRGDGVSVNVPALDKPRPGRLFALGLMNLAAGLISR